MKTLKCVLALFAFVGLMLVGCSDESQSPVSPLEKSSLQKSFSREFTGDAIPTGVDFMGIFKYPDGKVMLKDHRGPTYFTATFFDGTPDLLTGPGKVEINGLSDYNTGVGKWHGKLTLTPTEAEGGEWQFVWHGTATFNTEAWTLPDGTKVPGWIIPLKEEGHGTGFLTGMQCRMVLTIYAPADLSTWKGEANGFIYSH